MFLAAGLTVAPTITGSLFAGNTAAGAGGGGLAISVGNVVSPTPTLISKTIFEENSMTNANGAGGGVDIVSGKVTFSGVKFLSNRSAGNGGALDLEGLSTVLVKGSTFSGNAANLATGFGGAIHAIKSGVNQPTLTVQGGVFSANHAGYGGAIMADVGSTLNVTGAKVLNNVAQVFGGGFNIYDDGTATTSATINNTLFSGNRAIVSDGGGIVANVHGALMLTGDKFVGNYAGHDGGGAGLITTNANIFTKCQFIGNVAGSHNGGGLILGGSGGKQLVSTIFKGNFAAVSGGGLEVGSTSSAVNVIACLITGNTAVISGGGIRNDSGSPVTLGNGSKATGNTAGAQADLSGV
jgi:hypothetical protein